MTCHSVANKLKLNPFFVCEAWTRSCRLKVIWWIICILSRYHPPTLGGSLQIAHRDTIETSRIIESGTNIFLAIGFGNEDGTRPVQGAKNRQLVKLIHLY